jgi:uncharacterized protein YjbJ (UPF0337 family)
MHPTREKAQGFTKQIIGEMIGDDLLVREGKEQLQHAQQGEVASPGPPSPSPPERRQEPS